MEIDIEPHILKEWMEKDEVCLIDVRESWEYAEGHLKGARLLPMSTFDPADVPLEPGKRLVFYCRSGGRSGRVIEVWKEIFGQGYNLRGGMIGWLELGFQVEKH